MSTKRFDIRAILRDPVKRRTLLVNSIIATQAREGITTTREQAEAAYDRVNRTCYDAEHAHRVRRAQ
jgi:transglutaminase-like putative cysteine protease